MRIYHDPDADLSLLEGRRIAVIGYGNQGRAQALNLRDSGLDVVVGNRDDAYAAQAREDGFDVLPLREAAGAGDVVMLLIPDEVMPARFAGEIAPELEPGDVLVFASGYSVAFGFIAPPPGVDVVLVAPRMIGAGVRDLYVAGRGFPAFVGVAQDASGQAQARALALAKGIGATRMGVVEVTFAQEAELDLFTEQCFGPAFGQVLMTAVNLLLDEGYPPEAVLLELYMSGEFAYTLGKIAELGTVEQTALHSRTSQYGSMSRGMRFLLPELRARMAAGLEEIRSGAFAREWAAEQEAGASTLETLREAARTLPLHALETELRQALGIAPGSVTAHLVHGRRNAWQTPVSGPGRSGIGGALGRALTGLLRRFGRGAPAEIGPLSEGQQVAVLRAFVDALPADAPLRAFAQGRAMTAQYVLSDLEQAFYMGFHAGAVTAGIGEAPSEAEVCLTTTAQVLDGMLSGRSNAMRAAMTGKLAFEGDTKLAISLQRIQDDLVRLYSRAREQVTGRG
jgi:ketol-acid reductoisomerase